MRHYIRRVLTIGLALIPMLLVSSGSNLLTNGSFETGDLTGWVDPGAGGSATVGAPTNVPAQDGNFAALITQAGGVGELRQTFPASEGDEFNMSGWLLTEAALPVGPSFGLFKIVFRDAADNDLIPASASIGQINTDFPGIESLPFLDSTSSVDTWVFSEAQGVAPAGTTQVLFLALNVDFGGGVNPIWFDNIQALSILGGGNLLTNGSFETGDLTGWSNPGGGGGNATVGAPVVGAQDGDFAVRLELETGVSEIRQTFPANPGDEFNMNGYMLTEAQLPVGDTFGLFKIVFRDANGADLLPESASIGQINTDFPGIESLPFLNSDSPVDTWIFSEAQGVAPAGTTQVLFLVLNVDFAGGLNPMWFDNIQATLSTVPVAICPDTATVTAGANSSGSSADICDEDSAIWTLQSETFAAAFTPAPIAITFEGNANPVVGGTDLTLRLVGGPQFSNDVAFIQLRMFDSNGAPAAETFFPESDSDNTVYEITRPVADFVGPNGELRAEITCAKTVNGPIRLRMDQVGWQIQ